MPGPTSLEQALLAIARGVDPLIVALARPAADVELLIERLGWSLPSVPPAITALSSTTESLGADVVAFDLALDADTDGGDPSGAVIAALLQVAADVAALVNDLGNLPAQLAAQVPPPVLAATQIDQRFTERLLNTLVDELLEVQIPLAAALLRLLTLREVVEQPADAAHFQPAFTQRTLHFDRLGRLVTDPAALMRDVYGWGTPTLDHELLFDALMSLGYALGSPGRFRYPGHEALETLAPGIDVTAEIELPHELVVPLVIFDAGPASAGVSLGLMPAPLRTPTEPQGLVATLLVSGGLTGALALNQRTSVSLQTQADLSSGLSAVLRPGQPPELHFGLGSASPSAMASGRVELKLTHTSGDPNRKLRLLTILEGTYLEAGALTAHALVDASRVPPELIVGAAIEHGRFALAPAGADGFLAKLLPSGGLNVDFDVGVDFSHNGLRLSASGGMETDLALHLQIGPLRLDGLHLAVALAGDALNVETSLRASAALGPFAASVERVGARTVIAFHDGNLGPIDLGLRFKPPNGMGLSLDAGVVKGGGYLYFDPDKAEYAGILELSLKEIIQLKAIGLLTTRMPDGSDGFSLLVIITAEFPPIQLGFGFTLTGVGGLAGVNRTMVVDALRSGLRNHTLDSILFPQDPVRNASRIISDLRTVFPPAQGRYVFGPMLQLGWGTPTLISAELGVLLELPAPVRIAILGQIRAVLPSEDAPIVQLHIDVLGVIDFERKTLAIDATIYDSSILVYTLTGDMALRLDWGDVPSFAVSLGGLHPRFQPPPGFPTLRRLTLSLGSGDNPRLSCENYMALTSNSVQFGARVELYASAAGFSVHGFLGFDVLIILSPFSFEAGMEAGVELLRGSSVLMSLHLSFTLSGPTPWHAWGSASFKILFVSISVDFDVSWGDDTPATVPAADARGPLLTAFADSRNWHAELPAGSEQAISLGKAAPPQDAVLVHPLGSLTVRQTTVPLDVTISRFGTGPPDHWTRFEVSDVTLGTGGSAPRHTVQDRFARGQFFELNDEDKLGKPAFEPMDAGVQIGAGGEHLGHRSKLDVRYETGIVDDVELPLRRLTRLHSPIAAHFAAHLRFGAAANSMVLNSGDAKYVAPGTASAIAVEHVRHVVVSTDDLTVRSDVLATSASFISAEGALRAHLGTHPEDAGRVQVVPVYEAVGA